MEKTPRGRPRTLDRQQTTSVALRAYWEEGVHSVSLNEICRRAAVSKPGVYREFGNEDGLMRAALEAYQRDVLEPFYQVLAADKPFRETLDGLIGFVTQERTDGFPAGCLLVKMREANVSLGKQVRQEIAQAKQRALTAYEAWVERAQQQGEFSDGMSPQKAAVYIDAQLNNAVSLVARGEPKDEVKEILSVAFSVLK